MATEHFMRLILETKITGFYQNQIVTDITKVVAVAAVPVAFLLLTDSVFEGLCLLPLPRANGHVSFAR